MKLSVIDIPKIDRFQGKPINLNKIDRYQEKPINLNKSRESSLQITLNLSIVYIMGEYHDISIILYYDELLIVKCMHAGSIISNDFVVIVS